MTKHTLFIFAATAAYSLTAAKPGAFTDPAKAGPEYQIQGEYAAKGYGAQVIALGDGKFRAVLHQGGLPGDGWDKKKKTEINGQTTTGGAAFEGGGWKGSLTDKSLTLTGGHGEMGGGVHVSDSTLTLVGCVIQGTQSEHGGGIDS